MIIWSSVSDTVIAMHLSTFFKLENSKRDELWGASGSGWFQSFQLFLETENLNTFLLQWDWRSLSLCLLLIGVSWLNFQTTLIVISSIKTICIIFFTLRSNKIFFSLLRGCIVPICLAWHVLVPNIWSLTEVKANCRAKGKLFMFLISAPLLIAFRNSSRASRDYS